MDVLEKEIMWEYNCNKFTAQSLIQQYSERDKYQELCDIVMFKRTVPKFVKEV